MDYHEGDLASFLMEAKQNQNLLNSYNKVAQLVACIARGLEFLHENNIIHGDLKPGNILVAVAEGGRRKLLISDLDDFVQMQGNVTCSADISQMRGTKRYMSPEMLKKFSQAETDSPGRKTDIWSLGCIILEMDQISSGVLEIQLVKDGNVVNAGDNLSNDQYAIKIMDGYMPVVGGGNAPNSADLIRKCLDPVAANRISSKELLHELRNKQVIVLFPCDCEIDYAFFIILFDPATGSLNPKKSSQKTNHLWPTEGSQPAVNGNRYLIRGCSI
ncbi:uncharacterized protein LOC129600206 isoform X2 [Paramacrobiotus metropolitanus]|nr:uncharacterized protein LOC129600206 isoform X2 [Paramacrobiotus metropolitanus]